MFKPTATDVYKKAVIAGLIFCYVNICNVLPNSDYGNHERERGNQSRLKLFNLSTKVKHEIWLTMKKLKNNVNVFKPSPSPSRFFTTVRLSNSISERLANWQLSNSATAPVQMRGSFFQANSFSVFGWFFFFFSSLGSLQSAHLSSTASSQLSSDLNWHPHHSKPLSSLCYFPR